MWGAGLPIKSGSDWLDARRPELVSPRVGIWASPGGLSRNQAAQLQGGEWGELGKGEACLGHFAKVNEPNKLVSDPGVGALTLPPFLWNHATDTKIIMVSNESIV